MRSNNNTGTLVIKQEDSSESLDISALTPGIYFLKATAETGKDIAHKIIKTDS